MYRLSSLMIAHQILFGLVLIAALDAFLALVRRPFLVWLEVDLQFLVLDLIQVGVSLNVQVVKTAAVARLIVIRLALVVG